MTSRSLGKLVMFLIGASIDTPHPPKNIPIRTNNLSGLKETFIFKQQRLTLTGDRTIKFLSFKPKRGSMVAMQPHIRLF